MYACVYNQASGRAVAILPDMEKGDVLLEEECLEEVRVEEWCGLEVKPKLIHTLIHDSDEFEAGDAKMGILSAAPQYVRV